MKAPTLAFLAILLAIPAFGADAPVAPARVVREFVTNTSAQDWVLDGGWSWSEGTLTHWAGSGTKAAKQATMPTLTAGRLYRADVTFSGRTKGSVVVTLGGSSSSPYATDGTFSVFATVADPDALLTFTTTNDFDGSISKVRVVELGDELVDKTGWSAPGGWSQDEGTFRHTPGSALGLERPVDVTSGHTYRVFYSVVASPNGSGTAGMVSLGGVKQGWFYQEGNWNYAFDMTAVADGDRLVYTPQGADAPFDGAIFAVSVREITSDPASTQFVPVSQ